LIEIGQTTFREKAKVAKLKLPFPQNQSKKPVKHKELGVTKIAILHHPQAQNINY
jgi:hypothetical protein